MLESEVERHLRRRVEALGGVCLKFTVPGERGWPDRLVIIPGGETALVELKRPKGGRLSENQKENLKTLERLGFPCAVLNTKEKVDEWFEGFTRS